MPSSGASSAIPGSASTTWERSPTASASPLPGTSVPRGLATSSIVRCNDLLDDLLRQVVVDGGPGTRQGGFGLYEMMHIVEDSFSGAHTQRAPGGVDYLRVWKPIEKIAGPSTERERQIPDDVFHKGDDHRDKTYVVEGGAEACETRVDHPYDVPYSCLSEEGDLARQAIVDLLVTARDLRVAQLAASPGTDTHPETSPAWRQYRARWLTAAPSLRGGRMRRPRAPRGRPRSVCLSRGRHAREHARHVRRRCAGHRPALRRGPQPLRLMP